MRYATLILLVISVCGASETFASTPFETSGETFQADLYPSRRTAVIRLTQQLAEQIRQKTEALTQVAMKLGEAMYRAQQGAGGDAGGAGPGGGPGGGAGAGGHGGPHGGPGGGAAGNDKVVDADFEEVDDQKRRGSA